MRTAFAPSCAASSLLLALAATPPCFAAEGGQTPFLKGYRDMDMGVVPPTPGFYFRNDALYYDGDIERTVVGGRVEVGVDMTSFAYIPALTWVSEKKIFGGQYAISAFTSLVDSDVSAHASGAFASVQRSDTKTGVGDSGFVPLVLGWHGKNNTHWNAGAGIVIPTGAYDSEDLANDGLNRWAVFYQAGFSYLNPASGVDISIGAAYVVSFENEDTDYNSGDMLQVDFAASKAHGKWRPGIAGYTMWQVTDDSGSGARLGDFRSQVYAAGPMLAYTAGSEQKPITLLLKWTIEFGAENAPEGNTVTGAAALKF